MSKGQKLINKLHDFKDQYQQGLITIEELVLFCARAGIDATQEIFNEHVFNIQPKEGKHD